ncbi:hypothetical protein B0J18DRAFT_436293 [Chaetomium sp. MPI-SDFR-AT-0129]|nr:hypothetical protein B0J18DRAFT_436293 [Chaetomium sp. MPI-SDFR-AT-0129]
MHSWAELQGSLPLMGLGRLRAEVTDVTLNVQTKHRGPHKLHPIYQRSAGRLSSYHTMNLEKWDTASWEPRIGGRRGFTAV